MDERAESQLTEIVLLPLLCITTPTALLDKDADKLPLGQILTITNARTTRYPSLLLNPPKITFQAPAAISLATLSPASDLDRLLHDYSDILAHIHRTRRDLQDVPLDGCRGNMVHQWQQPHSGRTVRLGQQWSQTLRSYGQSHSWQECQPRKLKWQL